MATATATTVRGLAIGGFPAAGIRVSADGVNVVGNHIGVGADGVTDRGNASHGIDIATAPTGVRIGGDSAGDGNVIRFNGGDGVATTGGATPAVLASAISANRIYGNDGLAVDLGDDGVTTTGVPVLVSALESGGVTTIEGTLDAPAGLHRIDFYLNPSGADPSGHGEAEQYLSSTTITHGGTGAEWFSHAVVAAPGQIVTATASTAGPPVTATSELSNTVVVVGGAGAVMLDASIRRSDVVAAGGIDPSTPVAGVAGFTIDFPGGPGRLVGPALDLTSPTLSLAAWVNLDTSSEPQAVISKQDPAGNVIYELGVDGGSGQAVATMRIGGASRVVQGGTVTVGAWHHLAAHWDGTDLVLTVNGVEVDRVGAVGALATDVTTRLTIGNRADTSRPVDGRIDQVVVGHGPASADRTEAHYRLVGDPGRYLTVGAQQSGVPAPWTVTGTQTRSGSFSLTAPTTSASTAPAWAVATGIDEPGLVFESWWWISTDSAIDLAAGTRAGLTPTDQYEAALTSAAGWELRRQVGTVESVDAAAAGTPITGAWVKVEIWTDQTGTSRLLIDGTEVTTWTAQGADLASGSAGLRAAALGAGEQWFVDDPRARRLVIPEPLTSLGPLDRN